MSGFVKEKIKKTHNGLFDRAVTLMRRDARRHRKPPKSLLESIKTACRGGRAAVWALLLIIIIFVIVLSLTSAGLRPCLRKGNRTAKAETINDGKTALLRSASGPAVHTAGPDWLAQLIEKLWRKEASNGLEPPDGDDGRAVGPLQLHRCVVDDVNFYCKTDYSYADRRDLEKSKQIARLYIELWLDRNKEELAVRIFNGGPRGWRKKATDKYWQDIKNYKTD